MITIVIENGPTIKVEYQSGMNGQAALEAAYNQTGGGNGFTYSLQYYGSSLGYLVDMINETYDTFISQYHPYFFWQFLVNGAPSQTGIDNTVLSDGDTVSFQYTTYSSSVSEGSSLHAKFKAKKLSAA